MTNGLLVILKKINLILKKNYKYFKNIFKFSIKKKIIYSLSIFGFGIILGLLIFFISQSKKNESSLTNKLILLEKRF